MGVLDKLEMSLVDPLEKKAPALPPNARRGLAKAMWIIALVLGVLQLWAAWSFWHLGHYIDASVTYLNTISSYYGTPNVAVSHLGLFYYLSLLFLVVDAVVLLLATTGLKAMRKAGWNFLFYSLILNVAYGLIRMFAEVGGGFGQFFWTLVSTAIGAYFLFQIRSEFGGKAPVSAAHKTDAAPAPKK